MTSMYLKFDVEDVPCGECTHWKPETNEYEVGHCAVTSRWTSPDETCDQGKSERSNYAPQP